MEDEDDKDGARGSRYEGVANPEEEDEDDRFFGDGLTSDQKDILDYVDDIDPEEVTKKSDKCSHNLNSFSVSCIQQVGRDFFFLLNRKSLHFVYMFAVV